MERRAFVSTVVGASVAGCLGESGDWSDGTYAASAGAFNGPINVRIVSVTLPYQKDEPSRSTPEIELARTSTAPDIISDDPTPTN